MATYGKINCAFWSSQTIRGLSDDGRLMAAYLLTSAHTTICGAFRLPDGYAIEDLGWPIDRINQTLLELSRNGFAERCESTKWVVIYKFLEWNPPQNENQWKAVFKKASEVPKQTVWRNGFETVLKQFKNPVETVSTESESDTESDTDVPKPSRVKKRGAIPSDFGISKTTREWAKGEGFEPFLESHLAYFRDYAESNGKTYADWDKAFRNCIRGDWGGIRKNYKQRTADLAGSQNPIYADMGLR